LAGQIWSFCPALQQENFGLFASPSQTKKLNQVPHCCSAQKYNAPLRQKTEQVGGGFCEHEPFLNYEI
jgi:hypothetical protein